MPSRPSPQASGREAYVSRTSPSGALATRAAMVAADCAPRGGATATATRTSEALTLVMSSPPVDDVEQQLLDAWIVALAEPEDGLLAHLHVGVVLRDLDQLVGGRGIDLHREHPDRLPLHLGVTRAV